MPGVPEFVAVDTQDIVEPFVLCDALFDRGLLVLDSTSRLRAFHCSRQVELLCRWLYEEHSEEKRRLEGFL